MTKRALATRTKRLLGQQAIGVPDDYYGVCIVKRGKMTVERALFDGWDGLLRTALIGVPAYVVLIVFLRLSGKRTLSKMNAFDFIVTIALGSTLASLLLSKDVSLAQGAFAFALLIGLQFAITWSSVRMRWVRQIVTGEPLLLVHKGKFLPSALRYARLTEDEVRAAVRAAGLQDLADIEAVVLETDASVTVIRGGSKAANSALADVPGAAC